MRYRIRIVAMSVLLSSASYAQSSGCLPADVDAVRLNAMARKLVSSTDSEVVRLRTVTGIGALDSNEVVAVTDSRKCLRAIDGANTYLQTPGRVRRVHLVALANIGFLLFEPAPSGPQPASEWKSVFVVTKTFAIRTAVEAF